MPKVSNLTNSIQCIEEATIPYPAATANKTCAHTCTYPLMLDMNAANQPYCEVCKHHVKEITPPVAVAASP